MRKFNDITYSLKRYDNLEGNYTQISNDVYKITDGSEFKIYSYLCSNYNNSSEYISISLRNIAEGTEIGLPTVKRCINKLEEIGLIEISKSNKNSNNLYKINIPIVDNEDKIKPINLKFTNEELEILKSLINDEEEQKFMNEIRIINLKDKKEKKKNKDGRKSYEYTKWRELVLERDDYACQLCNCKGDDVILHVHHIKKHSDYKYLRTDVNNGITLCNVCHSKVNKCEEEYENLFIEIIIKGILKRFGKGE